MRQKNINLNIIFIGFILSTYFLFYNSISDAAECYIVKVAKEETMGRKGRIYLYPSELKVPKDSCVIWVSWIEKELISINFHENSQSCVIASEGSSGFIQAESCFFSDFLTYGKTVSLYFKEKGVFGYHLVTTEKTLNSTDKPFRKIVREGKIVVE